MIPNRDILQLLSEMCMRLDDEQSLDVLAARAGWSRYYLHRAFERLTGETPARYTKRVRLECAAAMLATREASVLAIAFATGFNSHEVFARSFRRHFGCSPTQYRARALEGAPGHERIRHLEVVLSVGPCVRLFHIPELETQRIAAMSTPTIVRKDLTEQPILYIRRKIARSQLQAVLGECFGKLFGHGVAAGLAIAGQPIARYLSVGPGLWTVDFILPLMKPAPAEGEMEAGVLPGGPAAVATHWGPYENLSDTNAAIERWIEEQGYQSDGPPWESYVTDPVQTPDPAKWQTEVVWPLAE